LPKSYNLQEGNIMVTKVQGQGPNSARKTDDDGIERLPPREKSHAPETRKPAITPEETKGHKVLARKTGSKGFVLYESKPIRILDSEHSRVDTFQTIGESKNRATAVRAAKEMGVSGVVFYKSMYYVVTKYTLQDMKDRMDIHSGPLKVIYEPNK
jgi:hypothetical protein